MTFLSVAGLRSIELVLVHTPVPLYLCTSYLPLFHPGACIKVSALKSLDPTVECGYDYYGMVVKEEKDRKECFSVSCIPFSLSADLVSVPEPTGSIGIVFCLGEPFRWMEEDTTMMQW